MQTITGGLFIFFLLILFYLLFHIWLEGRREQTTPHEIAGEELPEELREAALRPLKLLNGYIAHPAVEAGLEDYIVTPGLGTRSGITGAWLLALDA